MNDENGDFYMERWGSGDWVKHEDYAKLESLHREIIEKGRKVLNSTLDEGMSNTEYIEWVMERLEGK